MDMKNSTSNEEIKKVLEKSNKALEECENLIYELLGVIDCLIAEKGDSKLNE